MSIARALLPLAAVLMLGAALPVFAVEGESPFPANLNGMLGDWSLQSDDGDTFQCTITLLPEWGIGGYQVSIPDSCTTMQPTADIAAWYIGEDGSVVFINALRETVLTLPEMGDGGMFGTDVNAPPQYYMVKSDEMGDCGDGGPYIVTTEPTRASAAVRPSVDRIAQPAAV